MLTKPKKSLGQNFLIDKNIINKIVSISNILNKDVLEIGPGTGNLTEYILREKPKKLFLVEKDKILCDQLQTKFQDKVEIINNDILKINEKNISKNKLVVFGNLPHNFSTEIIFNWILKLEEVSECFHVSGEYDYILKVYVKDMDEYREFMVKKLTAIKYIGSTHSTFAIEEVKNTTEIQV